MGLQCANHAVLDFFVERQRRISRGFSHLQLRSPRIGPWSRPVVLDPLIQTSHALDASTPCSFICKWNTEHCLAAAGTPDPLPSAAASVPSWSSYPRGFVHFLGDALSPLPRQPQHRCNRLRHHERMHAHGLSARCRAACRHRDWCLHCRGMSAPHTEGHIARTHHEIQLDGPRRIGFSDHVGRLPAPFALRECLTVVTAASLVHSDPSSVTASPSVLPIVPSWNPKPSCDALAFIHPADIDFVKESAC